MNCTSPSNGKVRLGMAERCDLDTIYQLRHEVYARELGQHPVSAEGRLTDHLDGHNHYIIARQDDTIVGFISITPPSSPRYSVDKYFGRETLPFPFDEKLYELRILTVLKPYRSRETHLALMYAGLRWVQERGGTRIVAIGRRDIMGLYEGVGLKPLGRLAQSGAVTYELMSETVTGIQNYLCRLDRVISRIEQTVDWQFDFPFWPTNGCYHGGAFFQAVGVEFDRLESRSETINADVLDAWFPPSPKVLLALRDHLEWLVSTSPPTGCEGLISVIGRVRGVSPDCVLPGAGSSDLIFRAFRHWLNPASRILILDPTYGEYPHVLEHVIGCHVDRLPLRPEQGYRFDPAALRDYLDRAYNLIVIVNPNSPTGHATPADALRETLRHVPAATRVWIDETYLEYVGPDQSLERFAVSTPNVLVCKSMSKVYALSGLRVAYLCASAATLKELRPITPPWVVGLPSQVAAVNALEDPGYYATRYQETHALRYQLAEDLGALPGFTVFPGVANFLLCQLPPDGPDAAAVVHRCRSRGLFVRDASKMSAHLGDRAIRIAVKDAATNQRIVAILESVLT
ncbi:MAG TPA: aminotransferase class I/II-fold pyridoxal phosphate-dependent enzyme [Verrucomicrobiae bacterium]|nr:aminotransferase class I/II-fold pyridoxal phosphate-dependent enzyme [Verrucomicrobiae bacterium]